MNRHCERSAAIHNAAGLLRFARNDEWLVRALTPALRAVEQFLVGEH